MRLFFGIELEHKLKTQLIDFQASLPCDNAQKVNPANFHITLSFLGDVKEKQLEQIIESFMPLTEPYLSVKTQPLSYWKSSSALVLEVIDSTNGLTRCKNEIESQLNELRLRQFNKQPFKPHITLLKNVESRPKIDRSFEAEIEIKNIVLFESVNSKHGVFYEVLESWPLQSGSIKKLLTGKP